MKLGVHTNDRGRVSCSGRSVSWIVPPLFFGLLGLPLTALSQLIQGANSLQFLGADNPSGTITRTVEVYFGPEETKIQNLFSDGAAQDTLSELILRDEDFHLGYRNDIENLTGAISSFPKTWLDPSADAEPVVFGGVFPTETNGVLFRNSPSAENFHGYLISSTGSTWYGNLSMNEGTTFSADVLTANTITTTSLTATSLTAGNLSVTGNATIGGTLNMSGNRITNVGDGINPTDAVNVRQLAKSQRETRAGISSIAAIAGIPSLSNGDDGVLGVGVGTYKGESAIAVGASKRLSDTTTFKFGVGTSSSSGDVTGSFGIGIKW